MKIADLEIKDQEFGEITKEPGLVSNFDRSKNQSKFVFLDICFG